MPVDIDRSSPQSVLELRILTSRVGLHISPPEAITDPESASAAMRILPPEHNPDPDATTCLLAGPFTDFLRYSGPDSQWLIEIAHDICDPYLKRGALLVREDVAGQVMWRPVNGTDPLIASTYLYNIQFVVSLSKISQCEGKSRTTATGTASTMGSRVKERDGRRCWISRMGEPLVNSHICPKRMGDHLLRIVYHDFVSTPPPPALSIYNEMCGITLFSALDPFFDKYELGLRLIGPNLYQCHHFIPSDWPPALRLTIYGGGENLPETRGMGN
ncbi:hypothetical protein BJV74DRAFT_869944 [Russula compacta]|nr:hypothetical protein BJV74DRAFT_869944 [Russula compacta]